MALHDQHLKRTRIAYSWLGSKFNINYLMLEAEGIEQKNMNSVEIEFYPLEKENGLKIAGKFNPYMGKISIYPKTFQFCSAFEGKYGKSLLIVYATSGARGFR